MHRLPLILLFAAAAAVAACQQEQPQEPAGANASEPVVNLPMVPRPQPPLDRASLLAAVAEATSATASGAEMPETVRMLDGRKFEIRIRFGCRGPSKELGDRWLGWSFDPENRRIRVRAMPTISMEDPLVARISGEAFEAVEGFWIPRPWLLQPVCPVGAAVHRPADGSQAQSGSRGQQQQQQQQRQRQRQDQQQSAGESAQDSSADEQGEPVPKSPRIGIAQFFTDQDPRTRRRDMRPYQASHSLAEGKAISPQGYDLVLSGRLRALPGRGVIQCVAAGPDSPPECVISAEFLRVWIEQPGTREVIAEWGSG